jgi:hypothetical protein
MKYLLPTLLLLGAAALGLAVTARAAKEEKKVDARVFELRTYHAAPGKMEALHARFRDHTCKLVLTIARVFPTIEVGGNTHEKSLFADPL